MIFSDISLANICLWSFAAILLIALILNVINLPGNWIIIGLVALWNWLNPFQEQAGFLFWILVLGLGITGEIFENYLQILKGRQAGATKKGMWGAFIASIVFSIILAPLFFGIGALIGAFLGAWLGCLGIQLLEGHPFDKANKAAIGALSGRMLGTICKLGLGAAIIFITLHTFLKAS